MPLAAGTMVARRLRAGQAGTLTILLAAALGGRLFDLVGTCAAAWLTAPSAASCSTGKLHQSRLHQCRVQMLAQAPTAGGGVSKPRATLQGLSSTDVLESMQAMIAVVEREDMLSQLDIMGEVMDAMEVFTNKCQCCCIFARMVVEKVGHASRDIVKLLEQIVEISTFMKGDPSEVEKLDRIFSRVAGKLEPVEQWLSQCAEAFKGTLHDRSLIARMDKAESCMVPALIAGIAWPRNVHKMLSDAWKADVGELQGLTNKMEADIDNLKQVEIDLTTAAEVITVLHEDVDAKCFDCLVQDAREAQEHFTNLGRSAARISSAMEAVEPPEFCVNVGC